MSYFLVGLGNPGVEYEKTRHNAGRLAVEYLVDKLDSAEFADWSLDKKLNAQKTSGTIAKKKAIAVLPDTFMNKSGQSVGPLVKNQKQAENLIVFHDDLDLPLGRVKMSFGKNSGGHKGVESIMRAIKTKDFVRVRIGISGAGAKGRVKKPTDEEKLLKMIVGKFKPEELTTLKKQNKKIAEAVEVLVTEGREKAMSLLNQN